MVDGVVSDKRLRLTEPTVTGGEGNTAWPFKEADTPDEITNANAMPLSRVDVHVLYRETVMRLDVLRRRVRENKDVLGASDFCRWLRFSGVFKIFEINPSAFPLEVCASKVRRLVEDLLQECGERMQGGKLPLPVIEVSELEMINAKLDVLFGQGRGELAIEIPIFQVIDCGAAKAAARRAPARPRLLSP